MDWYYRRTYILFIQLCYQELLVNMLEMWVHEYLVGVICLCKDYVSISRRVGTRDSYSKLGKSVPLKISESSRRVQKCACFTCGPRQTSSLVHFRIKPRRDGWSILCIFRPFDLLWNEVDSYQVNIILQNFNCNQIPKNQTGIFS